MPSQAEIKFVRSLRQKKFREAENSFIAEGPKVVEELLASSLQVSKIFSEKDYADKKLRAKNVKDKIRVVSEAELKKISALNTPNQVVAVAQIPERKVNHTSLNSSLIITLDGVSDPGNLGTIIRTAHWFGISTIICSENCVDAWNPKVVQAAMGSLFFVDVIQLNLQKFLSDKNITVHVYGCVLDGKSIYESSLKSPGIILLGSESAGISANLRPFITHPVTIPAKEQKHKPDSLNVASAASILCSQFFR